MPADPSARDAGEAFARVVVDELARHGVREAVLAPGSRSTPVALALAADERIRLHVRIDERSAAFLALGLARGSMRPVPVLCTSGTAVAHFHAAVLEADLSRLPLLALTADRPPELRGVGANQTVDQIGVYGTAVRWATDVGVPEAGPDAVRYWRSLISRAVAVLTGCTGGPPGPVHLNLPMREPLVPTGDGLDFPFALDGRPGGAPWTTGSSPPMPVPEALRRDLAAARRGVVVAGGGLTPAEGSAVADFSSRAGWPLVAEPHSNARRGPAAVRTADALLRNETFVADYRPDLVVVVGRVGLSRPLLGWLTGTRHVGIDPHGAWWDPTRTAVALHRCDVAGLAGVDTAADPEWLAGWQRADAAVGAGIDAALDAAGLSEPRVARDVAAAVPAGGTLVVGSSMPIRDLDLTMAPRDDVRIVSNRGVSGIDGFVSTASGVALATGAPTYALCGDLSLLHDVNGLLGEPAPDLTLVVVNNDGGGIFSLLPQATAVDEHTFERLFGTPHGADLGAVAAGYRVAHRQVHDRDELVASLAQPADGIRIIEVRTDRADRAAVQARLRAAADTALTRRS